jgi:hypothetical protein
MALERRRMLVLGGISVGIAPICLRGTVSTLVTLPGRIGF